MHRAQSLHSAASSEPNDAIHPQRTGSSADDLQASASLRNRRLPESPTFTIASRYFSEPLNDKEVGCPVLQALPNPARNSLALRSVDLAQMKDWVAMGHSPGYGYPHKSVKAQWQPWRVESRQHEQESSVRALRYAQKLKCPCAALCDTTIFCHQ